MDLLVSLASMRPCCRCLTDKYDHNLADVIAQNLKPKKDHWPPDYVKQHTLRDAMVAFGTLGDYIAFENDARALCSQHKNESISKAKWFKDNASEVNKSAEGLCYNCTRENNHASVCEHRVDLHARMHELDPLNI